MKPHGILIIGDKDKTIEGRAKAAKIPFNYGDFPAIPYDKTLIVESGTTVPFDLLPAAWHFLERWDAACPLYRYKATADSLGSEKERIKTASIVRDLRVLTHSVELLFVRNNETGRALIDEWNEQHKPGYDKRLSFLRAFYIVKPILCALPTSWLSVVEYSNQQEIRRERRASTSARQGVPFVKLELEPGRFVKVYAGDEEKALREYQERKTNGRAKF
jgi:hypothetical protein